MPFTIFNTLTRQKEEFTPADPKNVKFYLCGPTVYNYAHIGNLYAYVSADFMIRSLRSSGYEVNVVMNLTDVDDKTIRGTVAEAAKTGEKATVDRLKKYTQTYTDIFLQDLHKLGCDQFHRVRRVTEVIPEMILITQKLLDKGLAYVAEDGVYYSVEKFKNYGELAHLDFSGMKAGARVDNDEYAKDSAADFALWKAHNATTDGDIFWEAEFVLNRGKSDEKKVSVPGRPGWHIECSAMNLAEHGEQIDLHMGGVDLVFPHHQNEIAQTEGITGKQFCRCWAHSGHVMENGKRMAKRDGGFVTLRTLEDRAETYTKNASFALQKSPTDTAKLVETEKKKIHRAFRMMCAQSHYRQGFDFSWEKLDAAKSTIDGWDNVAKRSARLLGQGCASGTTSLSAPDVIAFKSQLEKHLADFKERMADDLDTPGALAVAQTLLTECNRELNISESPAKATLVQEVFLSHLQPLLGNIIDASAFEANWDIPADIAELVSDVMAAKAAKDWPRVDALRAQAVAKGWRIVDQKDRTSRAERL